MRGMGLSWVLLVVPAVFAGQPAVEAVVPKEMEPAGVMDVPFGVSKQEALERLVAKHRLLESPDGAYRGDRGITVAPGDGRLTVPSHCIAGICYELVLSFGDLDKFYSYAMTSERYPEDAFQSALRDNADALSRIFAGKFGPPAKVFSPFAFDVRAGHDTPFRKWSSERFEIYVGLTAQGSWYHTRAMVADKTMAAAEASFLEKRRADETLPDAGDRTRSF